MTDTNQTAYLSGGCFWGMEELVRQIPGVLETDSRLHRWRYAERYL